MTERNLMRWRVGQFTITKMVQEESPIDNAWLFAEATPERVRRHAWLSPHFATPDGLFKGAINVFAIEGQGRKIIVDTGVGNDKKRANPAWNMLHAPFLHDLEQAGYPVESIDTVICTHLHVDHVGWNTRLVNGRWVPTFPNARYLFARKEWEYWNTEDAERLAEDDVIGDSVRPIVEAGRSQLVEMDHRICDQVWFEPTPGHTPGHVSVHIASEGNEAVITGDMMHHPFQCAEPDITSNFCTDKTQANRTRRAFLERYSDRPVLVLGTHFPTPTAGHIVRDGAAWRLAV